MNNIQILITVFALAVTAVSDGLLAQSRPDEGFTEPLKTVLVAAPESGVIQKICVREGDVVQRGAVICQLDSEVLEASFEAARVKFESQGKIDAAQATLDDKLHHLEQMEQLLSREHASAKEVQQARLELDLAKANLQSAYDAKRANEMEIRKIEAQIERRIVRAPTHGVVLELPRQEGEAITTAEGHVATIVCLDQLRVRYFLTTDQALKMNRGDSSQVLFPTTQQRATAVVDFVAPVTDSNSGTVRVELLIDNQPGRYRSGLRCILTDSRSASAVSTGPRQAMPNFAREQRIP
jgi:RND family efflux transporter MFP subunit